MQIGKFSTSEENWNNWDPYILLLLTPTCMCAFIFAGFQDMCTEFQHCIIPLTGRTTFGGVPSFSAITSMQSLTGMLLNTTDTS